MFAAAVVNVLATVYDLTLPHSYMQLLDWFAWVNLDYITFIYPGACMQVDARWSLSLRVFLPLFAIVCWMLANILNSAVRQRAFGSEQIVHGLLNSICFSVFITFFMCPSVSARVLGTWDCMSFEDNTLEGSSQLFLRTDVNIRCSDEHFTNPEYDYLSFIATIYVFIWPVHWPTFRMVSLHSV